jgi:hypothetical protein
MIHSRDLELVGQGFSRILHPAFAWTVLGEK